MGDALLSGSVATEVADTAIETGVATPEAPPDQKRRRLRRYLGTRLVHLIVLVAVIIPFVVPIPTPPVRPTPEARAFAAALDQVPAGAAVLVSFDWEAGQTGEMRPIAQTVVRRLFDRKVRIIATSLTPIGPALAQQVLDAEATASGSRYGVDYVNLGYLPGYDPALVAFSADFARVVPRDYLLGKPLGELEALVGLNRAADAALVVSLAADEANVVRWIQQVGTRWPVRIVAGVSAGAGPMLMPYTRGDDPQLLGMLVGLDGAASFTQSTGQPSSAAVATGRTAQATGLLALGLLVVVGNVVVVFGWLRRKVTAR